MKISSDLTVFNRSDMMLFPTAWGLCSGDGDSSGGARSVGDMVRVRVLKLSLTLRFRRLTLGD